MALHRLDFTLAVNLQQDERVILEKVAGRRVCQNCQAVYNLANVYNQGFLLPAMKPAKPGVCDDCQGELVKRRDDNLRIVKRRLFEFKVKTSPVVERYAKEGKVVDFEAVRGVSDYPRLLEALKSRLVKS
jgi:adenylate kinase